MVGGNIRQYSMFIALLLIMAISHVLTKGLFLTARNLNNLFLQTGYVAVLAIGMVLVIICGHIDLSVGSMAALCAAIAAFLNVRYGVGTFWVILVALVIGTAVGAFVGFIVAYGGVPAFIVTLASMMFFRGAVLAITSGNTIGPLSGSFSALGSGYLPDIIGGALGLEGFNLTAALLGVALVAILVATQINNRRKRQNYGFNVLPMQFFIAQVALLSLLVAFFVYSLASFRGMPYTVIIVSIFVVIYTFYSQRTKGGRSIYAVGGNAQAAELSGIDVKRTTMMVFVSMGFLSAISGMLFAARMSSASPSTGTAFEMEAIAASYVGGVSAKGGIGTVVGALVGALVIASINNCMSLLNAPVWLQYMVKGTVLVIAVLLDIRTNRPKKFFGLSVK